MRWKHYNAVLREYDSTSDCDCKSPSIPEPPLYCQNLLDCDLAALRDFVQAAKQLTVDPPPPTPAHHAQPAQLLYNSSTYSCSRTAAVQTTTYSSVKFVYWFPDLIHKAATPPGLAARLNSPSPVPS
jgi:hypothetical protein